VSRLVKRGNGKALSAWPASTGSGLLESIAKPESGTVGGQFWGCYLHSKMTRARFVSQCGEDRGSSSQCLSIEGPLGVEGQRHLGSVGPYQTTSRLCFLEALQVNSSRILSSPMANASNRALRPTGGRRGVYNTRLTHIQVKWGGGGRNRRGGATD